MQFPAKADDMLLSGMLAGGQHLANRVLLADIPWAKDTSSFSPFAPSGAGKHREPSFCRSTLFSTGTISMPVKPKAADPAAPTRAANQCFLVNSEHCLFTRSLFSSVPAFTAACSPKETTKSRSTAPNHGPRHTMIELHSNFTAKAANHHRRHLSHQPSGTRNR